MHALDDLSQSGVDAGRHLVPAILNDNPVGDFHLHTDKYVTTNAFLPPGPVRETLFSTLVDYTSSITRRSGPTVRVSFLLRLFRGAYYSRSQGGRQTLPVLCRRTERNAVSRAWTDERSMDR